MTLDDRGQQRPDGSLDVDDAVKTVRHGGRKRRRWWVTAASVVAVMAVVVGIAVVARDHRSGTRPSVTPGRVIPMGFVKSDVLRVLDPSAGAGLVPDVVNADSGFGLKLLQQLAANQANVFFSPYSVATALTMTYAGARSETARQLAGALGITSLADHVHEGRNALDFRLSAPRTNPPDFSGQPLALEIMNSLWGQSGFTFLQPFLETLARHYGAGMNTLDFENAAEDARVTINQWVADHTSGRFAELLPPGMLDPMTRLVLVNAVSFKASWFRPFDPAATTNGDFTRLDGSRVTVPMMRPPVRDGSSGERAIRTGYVHVAGWQSVRLPYVGGASMVVLLPDSPDATLDLAAWNAVSQRQGDGIVTLTMPKFSFGAQVSLADSLQALGVQDLFKRSADLSGMDGQRDLYVKAVEHDATVTVDEHGTEAAAATGVVVELASGGTPEVTVTLDRPFTFVIQDDATGEPLFIGRVADPTAT